MVLDQFSTMEVLLADFALVWLIQAFLANYRPFISLELSFIRKSISWASQKEVQSFWFLLTSLRVALLSSQWERLVFKGYLGAQKDLGVPIYYLLVFFLQM